MAKIRMGVIGLNFGTQHVRTLANIADAELVAVAERNPTTSNGISLDSLA